ncbi:peptidase domain-containing ABC transporter [Erwinia sorbitola]|uniref:ABC-type xenobiotic transporter n=1 Tax=Erwinia sorbitola TaxID=2681984 RepID=A0A6I6EC41_9GAMM|nr:peptidase domain-containing ABC transporter [Erwinia sorbitola]QGU87324.1 ATP-binding cassette domain-containing protein [Erwinia sorbitola]
MASETLSFLREQLNFSGRRRVPVILQTEATECGLACLAMMAGWHGLHTDILSLRARFGVSSRGATLGTLQAAAGEIGLSCRALSLEIDEVTQLNLPCIIHWNFSHFVVLVKITRDKFVIHDPAAGKRIISRKTFSDAFTGVALEMWPAKIFTPGRSTHRLKFYQLFGNIQGFGKALVKITLFSLMIEFISLLLPVGTQVVMDHVIPAADYSLLSLVCLSLFSLVFLQAILSMVRAWSLMVVDTLTDIQWKDGLIRHMLRLPLEWFEKRRIGDIQSRFDSLDVLRNSFIHDITGSIIDSIMVVGALILLIAYGGYLTTIVLAFTAVYAALRLATFARYRQLNEEQIIKSAVADSHFTETLYGIATLRAQGLVNNRSNNWLTLRINAANAGISQRRFDIIFNTISTFTSACDNVMILWLGIHAIMGNSMTIGAFVAFTTFRELFTDRVLGITDMLLRLRMLSLHNDRISDIALSEPEPCISDKRFFTPGTALSLSVNSVTFRYDAQSPPILSAFNLQVAAGESLAITGPSGCGKSTLMKIMCGLTPPGEGNISVNEHDISAIGLNNYRQSIACILQDDRLFAGSLRDNLTGFNAEKDEEWMQACARVSHIHEDIMTLPMGYETLIGELGEGLSGGQRQRIFIARALYRRPGILFMDEATSHLDEENEAAINHAIAALAITRIIIAHRPSTIASAQRVVYLGKLSSAING